MSEITENIVVIIMLLVCVGMAAGAYFISRGGSDEDSNDKKSK